MSRKPNPSPIDVPAHPLPSGGGCYTAVDGKLTQTVLPTRDAAQGADAESAADSSPVKEA